MNSGPVKLSVEQKGNLFINSAWKRFTKSQHAFLVKILSVPLAQMQTEAVNVSRETHKILPYNLASL